MVCPGGLVLITAIHPDVVQLGWKAEVMRPGITHVLPDPAHTPDDYPDAVTEAGFSLRKEMEFPYWDVPDGDSIPELEEEFGEHKYYLIVLGQKPD